MWLLAEGARITGLAILCPKGYYFSPPAWMCKATGSRELLGVLALGRNRGSSSTEYSGETPRPRCRSGGTWTTGCFGSIHTPRGRCYGLPRRVWTPAALQRSRATTSAESESPEGSGRSLGGQEPGCRLSRSLRGGPGRR